MRLRPHDGIVDPAVVQALQPPEHGPSTGSVSHRPAQQVERDGTAPQARRAGRAHEMRPYDALAPDELRSIEEGYKGGRGDRIEIEIHPALEIQNCGAQEVRLDRRIGDLSIDFHEHIARAYRAARAEQAVDGVDP